MNVSPRAVDILEPYHDPCEFAADIAAGKLGPIKAIDPVFHTQCSYLFSGDGKRLVDQIYKIEEITGTTISINGVIIDFREKINKNTQAAKQSKFYDIKKLEEYVYDFYKDDYAELNYNTQHLHGEL